MFNLIIIKSILFYQSSLAFFLGGNCRYYPTCSHYAREAFETHSFTTAFYLTITRILRCHPFAKNQNYDPVPLAPAQPSTLKRGL